MLNKWRKVLIFLGSSAPSSHQGGFSGSFLAQGFALHTPRAPWVSCLGAESSLLTPLWFADEWDPACYGLHQAQPLGQEQPLWTSRGPVCLVSREAEHPAGLLLRAPYLLQTEHKQRSTIAAGTLSSLPSGPWGHSPERAVLTCDLPCDGVRQSACSLMHRGGGWDPGAHASPSSLPVHTEHRTLYTGRTGAIARGEKFNLCLVMGTLDQSPGVCRGGSG